MPATNFLPPLVSTNSLYRDLHHATFMSPHSCCAGLFGDTAAFESWMLQQGTPISSWIHHARIERNLSFGLISTLYKVNRCLSTFPHKKAWAERHGCPIHSSFPPGETMLCDLCKILQRTHSVSLCLSAPCVPGSYHHMNNTFEKPSVYTSITFSFAYLGPVWVCKMNEWISQLLNQSRPTFN